ncbi:START domain [Sesbania bispinosa]|nr:START domain [Sesbania bispinosa]
MAENFEANGLRRSREEDQSRSGSDNMDGISGDEQDAADKPPRKKRYHRHTPQQIQELEASVLTQMRSKAGTEQKALLGNKAGEVLVPKSEDPNEGFLWAMKLFFSFWWLFVQLYQTQLERHENTLLRQENDKLRAENMSIREAMRNPMCSNCGGPAMIGEISLEEQHLRIENARLKDELDRLELGVGGNGFGGMSTTVAATLPLGPDFGVGMSNNPLAMVSPPTRPTPVVTGYDRSIERSMFLELALAAMDELVKMAQTGDPLWIRSMEGGKEILNHEEYMRTFTPCIGLRPNGFVSEASRETGMVIINSLALVETLMDAMHAEVHVISPLVPVREVNFLRFCKQHAEGVWAVVDVSIDTIRENSGAPSFVNCRRLPSGCVVQDMPNGYSKYILVGVLFTMQLPK